MKANAVFAILFAGSFLAAADEPAPAFDLFAPAEAAASWNYNSAIWDQIVLPNREPAPTISFGRTELTVSGALVESFRRPRNWSDLSLGEKILNFPILSSFVPQPMPRPAGGTGRYFAWGGRGDAWGTIADREASAVQARARLISVSW
jgi:hypothetical protein